MKTRWRSVRTTLALSALLAASSALAQQEGKSGPEKSDDKAPEKVDEKTAAQVEEKPRPGPKYMNLRYDEDFSYLDGEPGSYEEDFFDLIKNIHLGDDWRLTLGGEFRFQLHHETKCSRWDTNIWDSWICSGGKISSV